MSNIGANTSRFPLELFDVKTNLAKPDQNLRVIFNKIFHEHTYQQSAIHAFTLSRFCGLLAVTLIMDNAKSLASALVSSLLDYCNSLCMILWKLTSPNFAMYSDLTGPCCDKVTSITQVQQPFTLLPLLFETTSRYLSIQPFQLLPSRNISRLVLSPIDTSIPNGSLMLWNCFIDFAVEHRFSCRVTEPGFTGYWCYRI